MTKDFATIFKEFADSDTFVLSRGLLEDYKRQAAQAERERILALLNNFPNNVRDGLDALIYKSTIINFIKGDDK